MLGLAALGLAGAASGCATPPRGQPVPRRSAAEATVLGIPNERFLIPQGLPALVREYEAALGRRRLHRRRQPDDRYAMLAVSGGGEDGAFGAGVLCGWSDHGTRPEFDLVTGVSTGALTAPFAFLGPAWDGPLRSVYTDITPGDVLRQRGLLAALTDDALADNAPLFATISRHLDARMLAEIARGYSEGRLLLVGTANLDAQLPVTWNIGAIAASGHPGALDLVRRILLASAAVPGAFPPVMFDVTVGGQRYQEMHVDGGAFTQVFLYPRRLREMLRAGPVLPARAYVIRNARLDPNWAAVDRRMLTIAGRAISTMIASGGYNDIVRIWTTTRQDGVDFNLAFIGEDFEGTYTEAFEQAYMRRLFAYAYERARRGYDWAKHPP
ncbi:patatin family protein [Roseomonas soli]|uniref:Patatin family protein n=2 Tax=Neoroseomonas soli TaxID=1081025 RepID=A0A9X9X3T1_9PROT|nr:patatin family protein [Neoroseomonas soli]